ATALAGDRVEVDVVRHQTVVRQREAQDVAYPRTNHRPGRARGDSVIAVHAVAPRRVLGAVGIDCLDTLDDVEMDIDDGLVVARRRRRNVRRVRGVDLAGRHLLELRLGRQRRNHAVAAVAAWLTGWVERCGRGRWLRRP